MREIREIYQRWLDGDLSQEDALFAIGDVLGEDDAGGAAESAMLGREGSCPLSSRGKGG